MQKDHYDEMIKRIMETDSIKAMYEKFIIKDITFKEWVIGYVDDILLKSSSEHRKIERGFK